MRSRAWRGCRQSRGRVYLCMDSPERLVRDSPRSSQNGMLVLSYPAQKGLLQFLFPWLQRFQELEHPAHISDLPEKIMTLFHGICPPFLFPYMGYFVPMITDNP